MKLSNQGARRLLILVLFSTISAQTYDVKFWGIPIGSAKISQDSENEMSLNLATNDFINNIYPIELNYYSKYNEIDYTVIETNKTTKQGMDELKYFAEYINNTVIYNDKDTLSIKSQTYSLLSLLNKIVNSPVDSVDTRWFNLENEGILYQARPLWNDTTTIKTSNEEVLCNHYRLDLRIVVDSTLIFDETDYFNDLFFDINSIRQLWVENWQKQRKLVKITVKNALVSLEIIND